MVILKFYLIWIAIAWGSSLMMLFIIFWFQACLNVVNCFILHTVVQRFHKRNSITGKVARVLFLVMFFTLWFNMIIALGASQSITGEDFIHGHLECVPYIYTYQFFFVYLVDFSSGLLSVSLSCFYHRKLQLTDGTNRAEREVRHLMEFVADDFDSHEILNCTPDDPKAVEICQKVRDVIFKQMSQHAYWTMIFGGIEMALFFTGRFLIQPYTDKGEVLVCFGYMLVEW
jgi:hypothetical protein